MRIHSTEDLHFAGGNIKGWPAMSAPKVAADLKTMKQSSSVGVLQEMRWPAYWRTMSRVFSRAGQRTYMTAPGPDRGFAEPIKGAQAIYWRKAKWKHVETFELLLHKGRKDANGNGISETRMIRAALLRHRTTGLCCWFVTTHFVVGGDNESDGPIRKKMLYEEDIPKLIEMLKEVMTTGHPIIFQGDLNIHRKSAAYPVLRKALAELPVWPTIVGEHGIEYLFVFDGRNTKVSIETHGIIPTSMLNTDHEVRRLTFRLFQERL